MLELRKTRRINSPRLSTAITIVLIAVVASATGYYFLHGNSKEPDISQAPAQAAVMPKPLNLESKMLVMGDVFWSRYINDWSMKSELKYAYPFQRLNEFHRDEYDAWVADMECPVTDNGQMTSAEEEASLTFNCSPKYLPEASKYFSAMTLANNHTDNSGGKAGWTETIDNLAANNIQSFGSFDPEDLDNLCDIISLPARVKYDDGKEKQVKLPMVWCGYHGVFKIPSVESIAVMKRYSDQFNVIAMPHSGAEYQTGPDQIKTNLYRDLIDGGAEVVIGDHAHWVQNTEAYKGHLIIYSLGNFMFDQQFNREVTRGAVLQMTASLDASNAPDLDKWLELAEKCGTYGDDCLSLAKQQGLKKLPLKFKFGMLGSDNSGKMVHLASPELTASIKQRLSWTQTIKGLSGNYSGE